MLAAIKNVVGDNIVFQQDSKHHSPTAAMQSSKLHWLPKLDTVDYKITRQHLGLYESRASDVDEIEQRMIDIWQSNNTAFK